MARKRTQNSGTLTYPLVDGYVHTWLAIGPHDQAVVAPSPRGVTEVSAPAAPDYPDYAKITELDHVRLGEREHVWEVAHCQPDHWLAWHGFLPAPTHRQAWGYVHLHSAQQQQVTLTLTVSCAARLWLHGELLLHAPAALSPADEQRQRDACGMTEADGLSPRRGLSGEQAEGGEILRYAQNDSGTPNGMATYMVTASLKAGANPLLLRLEAVAVREVALMAALHVEPHETHTTPINVQLPTVTRAPRRRQRLEEQYAQARLDRAVYGKGDPLRLISPAQGGKVPMQLRLQKPSGAIYAETVGALEPGAIIESVRGSQLPNGALDAVVMAPFQEFYNERLRARHTSPILIANQAFYSQPAHSADERVIEALRVQAQSGGAGSGAGPNSVYTELAKMAFGLWEQVDLAMLDTVAARVLMRAADALPEVLALITMRARMPAYRGFPPALLPMLDRVLLAFAASGDDQAAWDNAAYDNNNEAHQLMLLAARHLLAQLYPATSASAPDAASLVAWIAARGRNGFRHWHSDHDLLVIALAPLISLAHDEEVRDVAASLLDTVALSLALHTMGATFGASRARVTPATLRSGRFAPEASLMRLWWGTGGYQSELATHALAATTALALAGQSYVLPAAIRTLAMPRSPINAQPDTMWVQERHGAGADAAHVATHKTPDTLLSSAQAYRVGQRGAREHIWQATLGPEALLFATHPGSYAQAESAAPAWWVGNGVLPRVAQHHDALIALYALPATDALQAGWLPFTHAYFPIYAFDEHHIVDNWAFARVQNGYVALGALPGFTLMEQGPDAMRELRASARRTPGGRNSAWLCQMGRAATDGDFTAFQRKVLASAPQLDAQGDALRVTWTTARGETLQLGMAGPLMVNGQAVALDNFPRHHSPFGHADFPAEQLEIVVGEDALRLHF